MRQPAILVTSVILTIANTAAEATDWYTGQNAPAQTEDWIVAVDASATVALKSNFANVTLTAAPIGSLSRNGFRIRLEGLAGTYSYFAQSPVFAQVNSSQQSGTLSAGYEWKTRNASFALFGGVIVQNVNLSRPDPNNPVVGTGAGAKFTAEFYARPILDMMVAGYGSYATVHNSYYTRLKAGWAIWDDELYFGPEVSALGDDFYSQIRIGGHLTGIRIGMLQFGIAGGYVNDRNEGNGAYGIVDARMGF